MTTWQTMCFIDILENDMATKIIIKFVIVIKKMPPQHLKKKQFINIRKKQKRTKIFKKKKHEFRFGLFGKWENKDRIEIPSRNHQIFFKSSLLHKSTFEFITSFLLTPKKIGFFTSIGVLLPNFIFSTTTTIKLTCQGQDDKLNADPKGL